MELPESGRTLPGLASFAATARCCFLCIFLLVACLPPQLPTVVKIGLVAPFEGRYRTLGYDAIYAARLAVREINAAGGVGGRQLELVAYDDRGDAALARVAARNLVIDPDVCAVIGHFRQESTVAAQPIYEAAGLPLLAIGAWLTDTAVSTGQLAPAPDALAVAMIELAGALAAEDCAVWGTGPLATALSAELDARACRRLPFSTAADAPLPTLVFSALSPEESAAQVVAWRARGGQGTLIGGPELGAESFAQLAGAAATGSSFVTPYPLPEDVPGSTAWVAAYRDPQAGAHIPAPSYYALPTYEAVAVLAAALAEAGATADTRAGVTRALRSVEREGLLGRLQPAGIGHRTWSLYHYRWEQQRPTLIDVVERDSG